MFTVNKINGAMIKISRILFYFSIVSSFIFISCAGTATDEDIQRKVNDELKKDNAGAALNATVNNGVATITGECSGDSCSAKVAERIKKIKGVQDVQTNIIEKK